MFTISSSAFAPDAPIPRRYTCDGDDLSPPLTWTDPPDGTRSFVLLVDDPDAPDPAVAARIRIGDIVARLDTTLIEARRSTISPASRCETITAPIKYRS